MTQRRFGDAATRDLPIWLKAVLVVLFAAVVYSLIQAVTTYAAIPDTTIIQVNRVCQEDEVIIGVGDFDGETWDHYVCYAGDDLVGGRP